MVRERVPNPRVGSVEGGRQALSLVGEQMPVPVHRDRDRGVAEMLLDRTSVGALTYEQGGARMAQIVEPQLTRQARCCHRLRELTPIEVVVEHPDPTRAREDELGPAPSTAGQVLRQHRAEK